MKKFAVIALLFVFCIKADGQYVRGDSATGQNHAPQPYKFADHVSWGGNFGLQFGSYTFVGISPLLNYHFSSYFILGAGPIYQYYNIQDPYYNISYSGSIYGGRMEAICYLPESLRNIFIMGEYDILNLPFYDFVLNTNSRTTLGIPLIGGGYRQPVGNKLYFTLAILWSLSNSPYSPYANPIVSAGFDVGL